MKFLMGKKAVAMIGAAAMLASVSACGGSGDTANGGASSGGSTEITVWAWEPTLKQVVADFEKANPDIKVNLQMSAPATSSTLS